jgi:hypothetical protein
MYYLFVNMFHISAGTLYIMLYTIFKMYVEHELEKNIFCSA